jgi:signal transduction histidine kinase
MVFWDSSAAMPGSLPAAGASPYASEVDPPLEPLPEPVRRELDDRRAREQLDLLLVVSRVLAQHDAQDPAQDLPALIVPAVGDWCSVDLFDGDDLRRVAAHHVDPARLADEATLRAHHPGWRAGPAEVGRTGEATLVFDVRASPDADPDARPDRDHLFVLAGLGMVSVAMVPIRTPERVLGVLTVATGPDRRGPRPSDVAAFEELANRVAFALERAEVMDSLVAARGQAAELEAARRIAHDFGNLLTRIIGYTELAERRLLTGELAYEEVAEIRAAAEEAVRLTRALPPADVSGDRSDVPPETDACAEVAALEPTLRALAGGHSLRVVAHGPAPVAMDPSAVRPVRRNLVANAGHALDEQGGPGTVEVATGPVEGRPDRTAIQVTDDGVGMTPDVLAACRADGFTTRAERGGTGHGLTMVEWLVDHAGGELHVASQLGRGTTITVLLPRPAPRPTP